MVIMIWITQKKGEEAQKPRCCNMLRLEWAGLHHWKCKVKSPSIRDSNVEDHSQRLAV